MQAQRSGQGGPPPRHPVSEPCGWCSTDAHPAVARTEPRSPGFSVSGTGVVGGGTCREFVRAWRAGPAHGVGPMQAQRSGHGGPPPRHPVSEPCGRCLWVGCAAAVAGRSGCPGGGSREHPAGTGRKLILRLGGFDLDERGIGARLGEAGKDQFEPGVHPQHRPGQVGGAQRAVAEQVL